MNNEIIKIPIFEIKDFNNHPFQVNRDEEFKTLLTSIKENGLLNPIVVRKKDDIYEIVSGHRRKEAMMLLGYKEVNAIVKDLNDDEATIEMVDSNIYRNKILPSEKAFAYKMKMEAIKHQGKSLSPEGTKSHSVDCFKDKKSQVFRYIRLTNLIPEILSLVDNTILYDKKCMLTMGIKPAVELSYLTKEEQLLVYEMIKYSNITPSHAQTIKIRELSKNKILDFNRLEMIFNQKKGNQNETISFNKNNIEKVLPSELLAKDKRYIEKYIIDAINFYKEKKKCGY